MAKCLMSTVAVRIGQASQYGVSIKPGLEQYLAVTRHVTRSFLCIHISQKMDCWNIGLDILQAEFLPRVVLHGELSFA